MVGGRNWEIIMMIDIYFIAGDALFVHISLGIFWNFLRRRRRRRRIHVTIFLGLKSMSDVRTYVRMGEEMEERVCWILQF